MDIANLRYMANQIARNLAAQGDSEAVTATAKHIADFWDPRMKSAIFADDHVHLSPIARRAVEQLVGKDLVAEEGLEPPTRGL
ncbi:MAG: hypothetical protein RLZZ58_1934 [Pseudomonadota bacterium]